MEYSLLKNSPELLKKLISGTFEIRILENGQYKTVWSCIRSDFDEGWDITRKKISTLNKTSNVFFSLNPLLPACKSKSAYGDDFIRVKSGEGVSDSEIDRYNWLLIDLDPSRPKDVSSTDEEKGKAFQKAQEVKSFLMEKGFFAPVFCDSGNGFHLLFHVNLANSKENSNLLRDLLKSLSDKFSDDYVKVDRKVFNAARIVKFYGTVSRKGLNDTKNGRPHRQSGFIDFPEGAETKPNSLELLQSVIAVEVKKEKTNFGGSQAESVDAVRDFMDSHDILYREEEKHDGFYFFLEEGCVFDENHKGKDACVIVNPEGMRIYKCFHDSCEGKHWKDFVREFDPEYKTFEERKAEDANILQEMFGEAVLDEKGQVKEVSFKEKIKLFEDKEKSLSAEIRKIEKVKAERKLSDIQITVEERKLEDANLKKLKLERQETKASLKQLKESYSPQYAFQLDVDDKGKIRNTLFNFVQILTHDEKIKSTYSYNSLTERVHNVIEDKSCDATESSVLKTYIENTYDIFDRWKYGEAMLQMPLIRKFNPVVDLLETLKWDGKKRLDTALHDFLGAEDTKYTRFVSRMLFISAYARAIQPGIKYDNMVVLVGPQGCGKSTFCKKMALDKRFYTDSIRNIGDDNAIRLMQGYWIIEWGELSALNRVKDAETIKLFLSQESDVLIPKYANEHMELKRKCVFVGTTNDMEGFLTDSTGNRRFFPVNVTEGHKSLEDDSWRCEFEQIYAEAILEFRKGFDFIPGKEILEEISQARSVHKKYDPRIGEVENWVQSQDGLDYVCAAQIWKDVFENQKAMDTRESRNFTALLKQVPNLKYHGSKTRRFPKFGPQRYFEVIKEDPFDI